METKKLFLTFLSHYFEFEVRKRKSSNHINYKENDENDSFKNQNDFEKLIFCLPFDVNIQQRICAESQ